MYLLPYNKYSQLISHAILYESREELALSRPQAFNHSFGFKKSEAAIKSLGRPRGEANLRAALKQIL